LPAINNWNTSANNQLLGNPVYGVKKINGIHIYSDV